MSRSSQKPGVRSLPQELPAELLTRPLTELVTNQRALAAFAKLEVRTVGDLQLTPREKLFAQRGFATTTWNQVVAAIVRHSQEADPLQLLPVRLLAFPTESLVLEPDLRRGLLRHELGDVEALLRGAKSIAADPALGTAALAAISKALDHLVAPGLAQMGHAPAADPTTLPGVLEHLFAALSAREQEFFGKHLGFYTHAVTPADLAHTLRISERRMELRLDRIRRHLEARCRALLARLLDAGDREVARGDGALTAAAIPKDSLLHVPARAGLDPRASLRLLRFCFPNHFHLHRDALTTLPPRQIARLVRQLKDLTPRRLLPLPLAELERNLAAEKLAAPRGLLLCLLQTRGFEVRIDPERGELVGRRHSTLGDRLQAILQRENRPLRLDDLLFTYRDRHYRAKKSRLLDALRADERFLQVGRELWSLRELHEDELALVEPESRRLAELIRTAGGRHRLKDVAAGASERSLFLIADCLRRDAGLRDLGCLEYCKRQEGRSPTTIAIERALKRAMGEVPMSRFLQNQPPARRRMVSHLLRANRLFVFPGKDRVDLLTNYPFNEQRLQKLFAIVEAQLKTRRGYAAVAELKQAVDQTDIGGEFLSESLLLDILGRHTCLELLPGGVVALPSLGLSGWIQQRAREALRSSRIGLTVHEILAEAPELAEFAGCLQELLAQDPMVASPDAMHWQVV